MDIIINIIQLYIFCFFVPSNNLGLPAKKEIGSLNLHSYRITVISNTHIAICVSSVRN